MDAIIQRYQQDESGDAAVVAREAGRQPAVTGREDGGRKVRARLNGLPCLVQATDDFALTGQVAVAPVTGARAQLPPKGRRAMLELVAAESAEADSVEPIEITVVTANPRSGRFTARVIALSDEQERLLSVETA